MTSPRFWRCLDLAAQPFEGSGQIRYFNKRRVGFEATLHSHYSPHALIEHLEMKVHDLKASCRIVRFPDN
jgi:hypothetical protein